MKHLIILLITFMFFSNVYSQTHLITAEQLQKIRLLHNRAIRDSIMLSEKNKEIYNLKKLIKLQENTILKLENENINYKDIIVLKDSLNSNKNALLQLEIQKHKNTKKILKTRNIILYASAILNLIFIIKSLN